MNYILKWACAPLLCVLLLSMSMSGTQAQDYTEEEYNVIATFDSYKESIDASSTTSIFVTFKDGSSGSIYGIKEGPHKGKFAWFFYSSDDTYANAGSADSYNGARKELKSAYKVWRKSVKDGDRATKRQGKAEYKDAMKMLKDQFKEDRKKRKKVKRGSESVYLPMDENGNPIEGTGCDEPMTWC